MSWHVTLLFVHLLVFAALVVLLRGAPDILQRVVLGLLAAATMVLVYHYVAEFFGLPTNWQVKNIAYSVEHIAILFYVFRLFITDQERRCLPKSSTLLRSSAP